MPLLHNYQRVAEEDDIQFPANSIPQTRWRYHVILLSSMLIASVLSFFIGRHFGHDDASFEHDLACLPFLPTVLINHPPSLDDAHMNRAVKKYNDYLATSYRNHAIDGLSVAVVTSNGSIFEHHWGRRRANETESPNNMIRNDSQYRVASVSKLLLVYEAWILVQKGAISWDDHVDRYLPGFYPNYTSFTHHTSEYPPVTLRHLATHFSGLGHDWPAGTGSGFPLDRNGRGPPPNNGRQFPSPQDVLDAVRATPLVGPPGSTPVYSNTAFGVLGMVLVAANRAWGGDQEPATISELMQRDVFDPLGMRGTHYLATEQNSRFIVVPSIGTDIIDTDFLDVMNPSGGMFTSLADLTRFVTTLIDPEKGLLLRSTLDYWFKPMHIFEEDDWTALGIVWEIFKHKDSYGRRRHLYFKHGELGVTHAAVAVHPGSGYGVIVLMSGLYSDAAGLAYAAFDIFQPVFDAAIEFRASHLFAGHWHTSREGKLSVARITLRRGTLWIDNYVINGINVLKTLFRLDAVPLRSTGRQDEFRLDTGIHSQNGRIYRGCMPHWAAFDDHGMRNGAAVSLIYFEGDLSHRRLYVPSVKIEMSRSM